MCGGWRTMARHQRLDWRRHGTPLTPQLHLCNLWRVGHNGHGGPGSTGWAHDDGRQAIMYRGRDEPRADGRVYRNSKMADARLALVHTDSYCIILFYISFVL